MIPVINAFLAGRYQRLILGLFWGVFFAAIIAAGYTFLVWQIANFVRHDRDGELMRLNEIHANAVSALRLLEVEATSAPCSAPFLAAMQRVAFLPDGLNEFLYAPNGIVQCSTSTAKFDPPVPLGEPDIKGKRPDDLDYWFTQSLEHLGRTDTAGTIARLGSFAVAIPPYSRYQNHARWIRKEIAVLGPDGKAWNVVGDHGTSSHLTEHVAEHFAEHFSEATSEHRTDHSQLGMFHRLATVTDVQCDDQEVYCVATEANLLVLARDWWTSLSVAIVLAALFAWVCANHALSWLKRHWSFEPRFKRKLNPKNILIAYQPILDAKTGQISGCEVLARWRDIDGTTVFPDRFIGIVERSGLTLAFTEMVAERTRQELTSRLPLDRPLQVNFNTFACDFDSRKLVRIFSKFLDGSHQFNVAVELVESDKIDFKAAQKTIEELKRAGIKTYIDDFGTGYSSIERVARLAVDGVKLDKSFAMAPPESILGRMLPHVLDIIKTSEHLIVVEGVETAARLDLLRSTSHIDYIQGYALSRPLSIDDFVAFLSTCGTGNSNRLAA